MFDPNRIVNITWQRVLKVWWLWYWRSAALAVISWAVFYGLGELIGATGMVHYALKGAEAVVLIIIMLVALRSAFRKKYADFRLVMLGDGQTTPPDRLDENWERIFKVSWLVGWRQLTATILVVICLTFVVLKICMALGYGVKATQTIVLITYIPMSFGMGLYFMRSAFMKDYKGFRIVMISPE